MTLNSHHQGVELASQSVSLGPIHTCNSANFFYDAPYNFGVLLANVHSLNVIITMPCKRLTTSCGHCEYLLLLFDHAELHWFPSLLTQSEFHGRVMDANMCTCCYGKCGTISFLWKYQIGNRDKVYPLLDASPQVSGQHKYYSL